ncbi:Uncharacterized protein dnm_077640 [Desulfonema magnum]|uniref:Uncharacterized protein n=1 Tax=Desulfonema magnum TaxID=45655 RepID=A0A975GS50_9BACT|nr:Uncharacterized protein dnm_077640 [Desulfonema magnum]
MIISKSKNCKKKLGSDWQIRGSTFNVLISSTVRQIAEELSSSPFIVKEKER